jgi:hypothetical protein
LSCFLSAELLACTAPVCVHAYGSAAIAMLAALLVDVLAARAYGVVLHALPV